MEGGNLSPAEREQENRLGKVGAWLQASPGPFLTTQSIFLLLNPTVAPSWGNLGLL